MTDNERIATELMGWEKLTGNDKFRHAPYKWRYSRNIYEFDVVDYSADMNNAMLVVEALNKRGWVVWTMHQRDQEDDPRENLADWPWECEFVSFEHGGAAGKVVRDNLPQAIVSAAIKVLDREGK